MFWPAVSIGSRLKAWNTKPMCSRRKIVSAVSSRPARSRPATVTEPEVATSSPARQCIRVDLPEPLGPMIAVKRPAGRSRSTPRRACTALSPAPYVRVRPRALAAVRVRAGVLVSGVVVMGTTLVVLGLRVVRPRHGPGVGRRADAARPAYDRGRTALRTIRGEVGRPAGRLCTRDPRFAPEIWGAERGGPRISGDRPPAAPGNPTRCQAVTRPVS